MMNALRNNALGCRCEVSPGSVLATPTPGGAQSLRAETGHTSRHTQRRVWTIYAQAKGDL